MFHVSEELLTCHSVLSPDFLTSFLSIYFFKFVLPVGSPLKVLLKIQPTSRFFTTLLSQSALVLPIKALAPQTQLAFIIPQQPYFQMGLCYQLDPMFIKTSLWTCLWEQRKLTSLDSKLSFETQLTRPDSLLFTLSCPFSKTASFQHHVRAREVVSTLLF